MNAMRLLLLAALLLLPACASGRFSLGSSTAAGQASEILVLGAHPRIEVRNQGPGGLRVRFEPAGRGDPVVMELGEVGQIDTLPGPVLVRLEPLGDERVSWRLVAWQCGGLRADLVLEGDD
jgi:hypothetical protein